MKIHFCNSQKPQNKTKIKWLQPKQPQNEIHFFVKFLKKWTNFRVIRDGYQFKINMKNLLNLAKILIWKAALLIHLFLNKMMVIWFMNSNIKWVKDEKYLILMMIINVILMVFIMKFVWYLKLMISHLQPKWYKC